MGPLTVRRGNGREPEGLSRKLGAVPGISLHRRYNDIPTLLVQGARMAARDQMAAPTMAKPPMQPGLPRRQWNEMTACEVRDGDASNWIAIIPVAAIEQHGPHLPLATDAIIGTGILDRALTLIGAELPVTCLPIQSVGASDEHIGMAGTLTLRPHTLAELLIELGESVVRAGVQRVILINSHGGNGPALDTVTRALRIRHRVLAVSTSFARFGVPDGLFPADEIAFGIHGGAIETSVMQHLRPDLVRADKISYFGSLQQELAERYRHLRAYGPVQFGWLAQDLNPEGAVGDARIATKEKGRAVVEYQAARFAELCHEVASFDLANLAEWPRQP